MKRKLFILLVLFAILIPSFSQIFYKNEGRSKLVGTVSNGQLINGYKIVWKGSNYKFFSLFDYYVLGRCYVHSDIYNIVDKSYKKLKPDYPDYTFKIMECSKKGGGKLFPHRTHQNGTSIDFLTPLMKNGKTITRYDKIGILRYAMNFNSSGKFRLNKKIEIDFEKIAKHILVLNETAREHGWKIKKVILETNLKDEIFATKYGPELKKREIYFVNNLSKFVNTLHDDHYHIDFQKI